MTTTMRLRPSRDVRAVLRSGSSARGEDATVRARRRPDVDGAPARWTAAATRGFPSAVVRNRAKRRARAIMRELELPPDVDLVVICRPGVAERPWDELRPAVRGLVQRALRRELGDAASAAETTSAGSLR